MNSYTLKVTLSSGKTRTSIPLPVATATQFAQTLMETSGPIRIPLKTGCIVIERGHVASVELIGIRRSARNNSQKKNV